MNWWFSNLLRTTQNQRLQFRRRSLHQPRNICVTLCECILVLAFVIKQWVMHPGVRPLCPMKTRNVSPSHSQITDVLLLFKDRRSLPADSIPSPHHVAYKPPWRSFDCEPNEKHHPEAEAVCRCPGGRKNQAPANVSWLIGRDAGRQTSRASRLCHSDFALHHAAFNFV